MIAFEHLNKLILIFFLLLNVGIKSQEKIYFDKEWNETSESNAVYYRQIKLLENKNYLVKDFYINGQLQFEGESSVNTEPLVLEGEAIWYNPEGVISQKGVYENNLLNGMYEVFHSNGILKNSLAYEKGNPVGKAKWYDENGNLTQQGSIKGKKFHGIVETFYTNGSLKEKKNFSNGTLEGEYNEYFPSGEVANQANITAGEVDGLHVKYSSPGQIEFKVEYTKGIQNGLYEFYNSRGNLFQKGNAKNGIQDGKCSEYFYEGQLRKEYTIKDGLLDGDYIEYERNGSISGKGTFKEGKVLSFESKSLRIINNSKFSNKMILENEIEHWELYRDGNLILKSFYKNGVKTGKWEVYNFDGSKLYQTIVFSKEIECKDEYLQKVKEKFNPNFFLSNRFGFEGDLIEDNTCEGIVVEQHSDNENPIHYYKERESSKKESKEEYSNIIDYKDPANKKEFIAKNNCELVNGQPNIMQCIREKSGIVHKVYLSENVELLKKHQQNAKPKNEEIYFYFQKFEEREYDLNKERPNRYMGFKMPKVLIEAFKNKTLDYISVISIYEHDFWDVDNFSGLSAYSAFEKELEKY